MFYDGWGLLLTSLHMALRLSNSGEFVEGYRVYLSLGYPSRATIQTIAPTKGPSARSAFFTCKQPTHPGHRQQGSRNRRSAMSLHSVDAERT